MRQEKYYLNNAFTIGHEQKRNVFYRSDNEPLDWIFSGDYWILTASISWMNEIGY